MTTKARMRAGIQLPRGGILFVRGGLYYDVCEIAMIFTRREPVVTGGWEHFVDNVELLRIGILKCGSLTWVRAHRFDYNQE